MSLLPLRLLPKVRLVAAADYFLQGRLRSWVSHHMIGIIPLQRRANGQTLDERLAGVYDALDSGAILIVFPEGSRGAPERFSRFKSGIAHVAQRYPHVSIVPVFLHGFGKALPKGGAMLVPFFCDVVVGEPMPRGLDTLAFMQAFRRADAGSGDRGNLSAVGVNAIAILWGFAEATLFFIVPDVWLTAIAVWIPRKAWMACLFALLGALAGGALMYSWGYMAPSTALTALERIPGIHQSRLHRLYLLAVWSSQNDRVDGKQ
jgi:hypothetical protein